MCIVPVSVENYAGIIGGLSFEIAFLRALVNPLESGKVRKSNRTEQLQRTSLPKTLFKNRLSKYALFCKNASSSVFFNFFYTGHGGTRM